MSISIVFFIACNLVETHKTSIWSPTCTPRWLVNYHRRGKQHTHAHTHTNIHGRRKKNSQLISIETWRIGSLFFVNARFIQMDGQFKSVERCAINLTQSTWAGDIDKITPPSKQLTAVLRIVFLRFWHALAGSHWTNRIFSLLSFRCSAKGSFSQEERRTNVQKVVTAIARVAQCQNVASNRRCMNSSASVRGSVGVSSKS